MKELLFLIACMVAVAISGCVTPLTTMGECKKICRGPVQHYQDDNIECLCKLN